MEDTNRMDLGEIGERPDIWLGRPKKITKTLNMADSLLVIRSAYLQYTLVDRYRYSDLLDEAKKWR